MNEQQIIEAALKDGNMPSAQAAAYRLLLRCAEQLPAMENLEKEEASGGRSAATPSPDQPRLDPRVEEISRGHDGKWRALGRDDRGRMIFLGESVNLADLVGANDKAYIMLGELQIENSKLHGHAEALECQVTELMNDDWRLREREVQIATLTAERNEALNEMRRLREDCDEARRTRNAAQAECNRMLGVKRRLEEELEATQSCCKDMRSKIDTAAMVRQFNRKFDVPIAATPVFPERDEMDGLVAKLSEELCEFLAACGYQFKISVSDEDEYVFFNSYTAEYDPNLVAAADGLADMQYMIQRIALHFGIPLDSVFAEVHRSNMMKTSDGGGKIAICDGYEPPQIERILREHGWEG